MNVDQGLASLKLFLDLISNAERYAALIKGLEDERAALGVKLAEYKDHEAIKDNLKKAQALAAEANRTVEAAKKKAEAIIADATSRMASEKTNLEARLAEIARKEAEFKCEVKNRVDALTKAEAAARDAIKEGSALKEAGDALMSEARDLRDRFKGKFEEILRIGGG